MKTLGSPGPHISLPKLRLKRTRTCSSDSGCDVGDTPDLSYTIMEDAVESWAGRLGRVVRQEEQRARGITQWAREALRHAGSDEARREEVVVSWRQQVEGCMEFTKDLIECVNNDTKELLYDSMGLSSGHESTETIEELEESEEEKEEEIMQLFLLSAMGGNKVGGAKRSKPTGGNNKNLVKEFMSVYKKNGKMFKNSRKANKEVQTAYAKIKRQEGAVKRKLSFEQTKLQNEPQPAEQDFAYSQKMFDSVLDYSEIFSDWVWNLEEFETSENIFSDWRWNLEETADLKQTYYDQSGTADQWNDFHFWRSEPAVELDTALLQQPDSSELWSNCKFWEETTDNCGILHNLVDGVVEEEDWAGMPDLTNFWDESAANQEIVEGLMEEAVAGHEADIDEVFLWEERKPILDLLAAGRDTRQCPDEISFVWMDSDTITGLINMQDEEEVERFPWEDPQCIRSLLCHNSVTFPEDDVKETSEDETEWNSWPFWGEFGTTDDIINAYEINFKKQEKIQQINIEEAFWEISLEKEKTINSHSTAVELPKPIPKDPVNIFKSAKHIFNIPQEARARKVGRGDEGRHLFEDMEDVYGDWAKLNLSDERAEKKRQTRGRGKEKPVQAATRTGAAVRRPGTPPIKTVALRPKTMDFDCCWVETKIPKKERKTAHVWRNARSQNRLNSKIFAKQPR